MEDKPRWMQVLIMTVSELAFLILAVPLYIFLVLPRHAPGGLPGLVPLVSEGCEPAVAVLATAAAILVPLCIATACYRFFGNTHFAIPEMDQLVAMFEIPDFIPIYLAAGIGEEFLFRGALLEPCGLVVSSLLFTALHVAYWRKPLVLAYTFATGLVLGGLYLVTQSLVICMLAHAAYNFVITVILKKRLVTPRS